MLVYLPFQHGPLNPSKLYLLKVSQIYRIQIQEDLGGFQFTTNYPTLPDPLIHHQPYVNHQMQAIIIER